RRRYYLLRIALVAPRRKKRSTAIKTAWGGGRARIMTLVGVLGGGLQGCCTAIALAARRVRVVLFDKNDALLSRAAVANEGKIHLGYMYAGDPSLSTAKTMMAGALAFAPFLDRYLARPAHSFSVSVPATYIVHRESQNSAEDVCAYFRTVHGLINEAADGRKQAY